MGAVARTGDTDPATLRKAMLYGTVTASFCVQGFSIEDLGQRTQTEIAERYHELLSIVTV